MEAVSTEILCALISALVLVSAYFSGSETALASINRYRLRHLERNQHVAASKVAKLLRRPDRMLGLILIGNNLANILAASLGTLVALRLFGDWGPLVATIALTLIFLIFAEVTPKTIAACFPEKIAFVSVHVLAPLLKVFYPVVWIINAISNRLAGIFGVDPRQQNRAQQETLSQDELRTLVNEHADLGAKGTDMMLGVLSLENITVDDIMVPTAEIVSIDINQGMTHIVHQLCTSKHARVPIIEGGFSVVLGMLHLRKIGRFMQLEEKTKDALVELTKAVCFVPEGTSLPNQLINFQQNQQSIGLVVDEYGDVQGIITIEDIIEEVVGEFTDHATDLALTIQPQPDNSYLIDGAMQLHQINRILRWNLSLSGPKTLNGLIIQCLGMLPEGNVCVVTEGYRLETMQIIDNMVRMAKASRIAINTDEEQVR